MPGARDQPRRGPSLAVAPEHETRLCDETAVSEDDEDKESVGSPPHVNRNGFPMNAVTWDRMWCIATRQHPGGSDMACSIREARHLPKVHIPSVPYFLPSTPVGEKLEAIQKFMCELQYNHTGTQFYEIKKCRPFSGYRCRLMDLAKEMIRESLPIKCLEAVVLAIYLTNGLQGVERFPLAFRTRVGGTIFGHVVLGMWSSGKYGALGMSRRPDLMHRSLTFNNLADLVADFGKAYATYWHEVVNLKLGLFLPHNPYSFEKLDWNYLVLNVTKLPPANLRKELEKHARDMKLLKGVSVQSSPNKECKKGTPSPNNSPKHSSAQSQRKISYGDKLSLQGERNKETTSQPPDPYKIRV
uniref:tubulinyl-Tyr carboxypeptidase 1-like n=1 Tax=Myxine glutinosa TaxID=7769 RepID=UPI00358F19FC